jgi:hypothetical protein
LLAWTGGAVTLLGVVLLLALAASRGWFTPPARVAFGAVLGAGLVGLGAWLHRRESARAGALALVATGFATLYLVDAAATAIFGYLPALPALLLALVIAGAGLGLADRWRTQLLAGGVVVGAAVLAPALVDGWLLVALVLVLQLAAVLVVLRRRWAVLMLLAAAGPVIYGMYAVAAEEAVLAVVGVAAVVLLVALATAALALRRIPAASAPAVDGRKAGAGDGAQSSSAPAVDGRKASAGDVPAAEPPQVPGGGLATGRSARTWVGAIAAVVAAAVLPALVAAPTLGGWRGALLAGGAAAALAVLAGLPGARAVKVAAGVAAVTALLTATVVGLDGAPAVLAVLGEALVAALVAVGLRSRFAMITALVLGAMAWVAAVQRDAPITTLVRFTIAPTVPVLVTAVAASVLIVALAAALLVAGGRLGWIRPDASRAAIWVPIGLVGLYGAAGAIVNAALLVSPTSAGFTAGHAVVTVSWTVGALILRPAACAGRHCGSPGWCWWPPRSRSSCCSTWSRSTAWPASSPSSVPGWSSWPQAPVTPGWWPKRSSRRPSDRRSHLQTDSARWPRMLSGAGTVADGTQGGGADARSLCRCRPGPSGGAARRARPTRGHPPR